MPAFLQALLLLAALGSAIIGGTFFAFSAFVMRALGRLPAPAGIAAMQSINNDVINPLFMLPFLGTVLLSLGALFFQTPAAAAPWILAGIALYVLGTFGVTMAFNVPLNNRLAALDPNDPASAEFWTHYLRRWTLWNTIRTIAALGSTLAFILALRVT